MSKEKLSLAARILLAFKKDKYATVQTTDGTDLMYEGELTTGTVMTVKGTDPTTGQEKEMMAPGGEYQMGGDLSGKTIVIEEGTGKVLEIKDTVAAATEGEDAQAAEAILNALKKIEDKVDATHKLADEAHKKVDKLASDVVDGKVQKDKFKYEGKPLPKKLL